MFTSARIKLTLWYLIIITAISTSFSFFVYRQVTSEVKRSLHLHTLRLTPGNGLPPIYIAPNDLPDEVENQIYEELRRRIIIQLLFINGGIIAISALAGYFLAGKTLRPIEEMVEDQKRFVADASHELRTPLTAMKTEIEVALIEKNISSSDSANLLKSNLEEIDRMQKLTNYLLNLNKYQDKTMKLQFEEVDIKETIEKIVERLSATAKEKDIHIINKSNQVKFKANHVSLEELLMILIDNAIKYSKKHSEVILSTKTQKHYLNIEIQDFGVGIKSGDIPYIFNRFYRADMSRNKTNIDGYGLGLSIAKQIVELHHGTIDVISEPDKGSTFRIHLPLS